jgi:hypothetical protein
MLDVFQATNVQEDQQITILLRSLRKEMNTMTPKEHKWTSSVNYHSSELNPNSKGPYPYGNNWFHVYTSHE